MKITVLLQNEVISVYTDTARNDIDRPTNRDEYMWEELMARLEAGEMEIVAEK